MSVIANILAIIFLLKLSSKTHLNAPSFVASHYGNSTKLLLRQLETVLRKVAKRQADVEFLQICATYRLMPKFLRFKLYKKEREKSRRVRSLKQHLLLSEMRQQRTCIHNLNKKVKQLENSLYSIVGYVTRVYIMRFLDRQIQASKLSFQSTHAKKLKSLGLNLNSIDNKLQVVINQSNYKLSETETNLLNKGLKFGTFPDKLNTINIQTEFEDFYQQVRPSLIKNNDRLEFKAKLMHLYSKYKSTFYHNRKQQQNTFGLSEEEQAALHNLSHNNSIIICKPDKGNGVVILNRQDYIQKMEQILCNKYARLV